MDKKIKKLNLENGNKWINQMIATDAALVCLLGMTTDKKLKICTVNDLKPNELPEFLEQAVLLLEPEKKDRIRTLEAYTNSLREAIASLLNNPAPAPGDSLHEIARKIAQLGRDENGMWVLAMEELEVKVDPFAPEPMPITNRH